MQRGEGCIFPFPKNTRSISDELERCTTLGRENQTSVCAFTVCAYLKTQVCVAVSVTCVLCCWPPARCYCRFPFISPTFSLSLTGPQSSSVSLPSTRISPQTAAKMLTWTNAYHFFFLLSVHESGKVCKKRKKQRSEKEFRQVKMVAYIWSEEKTNKV